MKQLRDDGSDWVATDKDPRHIAREKGRARALRRTQWWKNQIAKGICHYCGKKFAPDHLTMDHIVPISRGGQSTKNNTVPCCKACNNQKKYMTPVEIALQSLNRGKKS